METESSTTVETRGRSSVPIRFDEKDVQDEGSSSFFPPPTAEQKSFKVRKDCAPEKGRECVIRSGRV